MYWGNRQDTIELGTTGPFSLRRQRVQPSERSTHTYVVGITGKGKSKLLEHILFQDITQGRGCGVLDPHGDLIRDLLHYLASNPQKATIHWDRIIYFDPTREDCILPFNVLNSPFTPYETTQNIVEAFRRTWPKALEEAPRFSNIATASVLTLIANNLTLTEMPRLLTDTEFRNQLLENIDDPELIEFWEGRYEKWGRETPFMIESLLNKVTAFTLNPHLRLLLGAQENALNFRQIMDDGKVLLVNLGHCDTETRRLVGSLVVTGLEQAARSRKDTTENRKPFYFTIDEFQDFCANDGATQTLAQILSECRKFGLHLTLAHQTLAQINERMRGALGNIQLKVVFGISRPDAEILAKHIFRINGERVKHQVTDTNQQDKSHPVFYSLQEEWETATQSLQQLPKRTACITRPGKHTVRRIKTITIKYDIARRETVGKITATLARNRGYNKKALISDMQRRMAQYGTTEPISQPIRERAKPN